MAVEDLDPAPTKAEWEALYSAAQAFQSRAPWLWMEDADLFGVQDPETGEIGYVCIMGMLGEMLALALYQGSEGLAGYWHMRQDAPFDDPMEIMIVQKCLMASFGSRDELQKPDLDTIKALGLKFRGRTAWPQFRSYLPGYQPWFLSGREARFLTVALEQAVETALRFDENAALLPPARPGGEYLVRVPAGIPPQVEWRDEILAPESFGPETRTPAPLSSEMQDRAQRLKALQKSSATLEIDFFNMPGAVQEENGRRPYYPYVALAADAESGQILGVDVIKRDELEQGLVALTLKVVESLQMLPAKIAVQQEDAKALLQPLEFLLKVRVTKARRLPAVNNARAELSQYMGL